MSAAGKDEAAQCVVFVSYFGLRITIGSLCVVHGASSKTHGIVFSNHTLLECRSVFRSTCIVAALGHSSSGLTT